MTRDTGPTVTMVTYCVTKMIITCSPIIGQLFDTVNVASSDKGWLYIKTHQSLTAGYGFEQPETIHSAELVIFPFIMYITP